MRGKPIDKSNALCFAWDDISNRHEEVQNLKQIKPTKKTDTEIHDYALRILRNKAMYKNEWIKKVCAFANKTGKQFQLDLMQWFYTQDNMDAQKIDNKAGKPVVVGESDKVILFIKNVNEKTQKRLNYDNFRG